VKSQTKLILVKILHTLVWLFFNFVLFYLLYAVIVDNINHWVWLGIGLIIFEGFVLLFFKMMCPLTIVARKYSDSTKENFDIYLPNWLAKYNKQIYTTLFIIILLGVVYRNI
jgi:hypothetical protein